MKFIKFITSRTDLTRTGKKDLSLKPKDDSKTLKIKQCLHDQIVTNIVSHLLFLQSDVNESKFSYNITIPEDGSRIEFENLRKIDSYHLCVPKRKLKYLEAIDKTAILEDVVNAVKYVHHERTISVFINSYDSERKVTLSITIQ